MSDSSRLNDLMILSKGDIVIKGEDHEESAR